MKDITEFDFRNVELVLFDFDGVFTNNKVFVTEDGAESVVCSRLDGIGLRLLDQVEVKYSIVSTETNPVVSHRARKLGIACEHAVSDKAAVVKIVCNDLAVDLKNTIFLGNDINDIPAFKHVGFPIAVADAWPEVLAHCDTTTRLHGGEGAVRELCDIIYKQKMGI